jgi:hypothetical protein
MANSTTRPTAAMASHIIEITPNKKRAPDTGALSTRDNNQGLPWPCSPRFVELSQLCAAWLSLPRNSSVETNQVTRGEQP